MRIVAGNWKMNKTRREGVSLAESLRFHPAAKDPDTHIWLFPPTTALSDVALACEGSRILVGGQNLHPENSGAFTGEVSARMLLEAGAEAVLVGHSERRALFEESEAFLAAKVRAALANGLIAVFCIGENLEARQAGETEAVLSRQIEEGLGSLPPPDPSEHRPGPLVVAYEPVWAIGTGHAASKEQIDEAHKFIRRQLVERGFPAVPLLYGGSVKPENAAEIFRLEAVDGVLVGGASLAEDSFGGILEA